METTTPDDVIELGSAMELTKGQVLPTPRLDPDGITYQFVG